MTVDNALEHAKVVSNIQFEHGHYFYIPSTVINEAALFASAKCPIFDYTATFLLK